MYIAKISFTGKVVGVKGHTLELTNKKIIADLLKAGYIEEVKDKPTTNKSNTNKENN